MTEYKKTAAKSGKALTEEEAIAKCERSAKIHDIKALAAENELESEEEKRKAAAARKVAKIIRGKKKGKYETATMPGLETIGRPGSEGAGEDEFRGGIENAENHYCGS